jgi:4-carboxymuconolactone decarboxylase
MSRLEPKRVADLTPEQREQHERTGRVRTVGADEQYGGPFDPWIRSAELGRRALGMGDFLWMRTTIGRRLVELAILVTARFWESNVEWWAHSRLARQSGVSDDVIDAIYAGTRPTTAPDDELIAYDVCRSLHERHDLPLEQYERAINQFGEEGLMELVGTIGYYTMVAMTLRAFEVTVPDGVEPPFAR